jgi:drug/metabolite transporter (DMT)-like permease
MAEPPPVEKPPPSVYLFLAAGLVCFASSSILIRFAEDDAPGLAIAVWRTFFAVMLLAPGVIVRKGRMLRGFTKREKQLIVVAGLLLGVHFIMWIESLYHTSVASASVLVNTSPVFLAVLGYLLLRERITWKEGIGIGLGVAGAMLIGLGDSASAARPNPLLGNSLALGAALVVSLYLLIGRSVRQRTTWLGYVFPLYIVAALTAVGFALVRGVPLWGYGPGFYGLCLLMAIGPQILGHGSLNYALRYFPAALLGLLTLLEPVGASALAFFLFGEAPAPPALAGIVLVVVSVSFVIVRGRKPSAMTNDERGR